VKGEGKATGVNGYTHTQIKYNLSLPKEKDGKKKSGRENRAESG
jgi:hypothetical protein